MVLLLGLLEQPEGLPDGCLYFGPKQLKEGVRGLPGGQITLYLATKEIGKYDMNCPNGRRNGLDMMVNNWTISRRQIATSFKRYTLDELKCLGEKFGDLPIQRIYDGLSEATVTMLFEKQGINLPLKKLDALLVNAEYLATTE